MGDNVESAVNEQTCFQKAATFARRHIFFLNFLVLNVVCFTAVSIFVKDKSTSEIIMIYNGVLVGCAFLSQITTRGLFASIPEKKRNRSKYGCHTPADSQEDGKLEEIRDDEVLNKGEDESPTYPEPENLDPESNVPSQELAVPGVPTSTPSDSVQESAKSAEDEK